MRDVDRLRFVLDELETSTFHAWQEVAGDPDAPDLELYEDIPDRERVAAHLRAATDAITAALERIGRP